MKTLPLLLAFAVSLGFGIRPLCADPSSGYTPIEEPVASIAAGSDVTVVHFWSPDSENSKAELKKGGWRDFLSVNPEVNVIFVTVWSDSDGAAELAREGVGEQANFKLLHHPNTAAAESERVNRFLGHSLDWVPTTWVFKDGKLRYAIDYGEVRFPMLQQMIRDAAQPWKRSGTKSGAELK